MGVRRQNHPRNATGLSNDWATPLQHAGCAPDLEEDVSVVALFIDGSADHPNGGGCHLIGHVEIEIVTVAPRGDLCAPKKPLLGRMKWRSLPASPTPSGGESITNIRSDNPLLLLGYS